MTGEWDPAAYGEGLADVYDQLHAAHLDTEGTVAFLAERAGDGSVLELGVGTGRVAAPLAARGLRVHGIDASPAMLEKVREKPGGEAVTTSVGDLRDVEADGEFRLIFCVANTFLCLPTQEDQVACFANVSRRLAPDGVFVIEALVPDPARYEGGGSLRTLHVGPDDVQLVASRYHPESLLLEMQFVTIAESGIRLAPLRTRLTPPPELDLMARLAGLRLRERWAGWRGQPFTGSSTDHVSV